MLHFPYFHALVIQLSPWYYCNVFEGECVFNDLVFEKYLVRFADNFVSK